MSTRGSENIIYVDESGFDEHTHRPHGWAEQGVEVYGERVGNRGTRTNLIAGKRGKDLLAPLLFETTTDAGLVNYWFEHLLIPELKPESTIIWDNARFHDKDDLWEIAIEYHQYLLFLPRYSPDFNDIEQDFATLKKQRIFKPPGTSIDDIIKLYGSYSE